jgi:hypothetical protein
MAKKKELAIYGVGIIGFLIMALAKGEAFEQKTVYAFIPYMFGVFGLTPIFVGAPMRAPYTGKNYAKGKDPEARFLLAVLYLFFIAVGVSLVLY